ncbi:TetR/AcrR family transcriptional regulator [Planctomycetota bacterium]
MPRPSNTSKRRTQIARALIQVMAERGYDGASIAGIARTAGLTPGLVHYHFKNKEEILLLALGNLVEDHTARLEAQLVEAGSDPVAEVAAFIDSHLGLGVHADPQALACWVLLSGEALRRPDVRREYAKAVAASVERLGTAIQRGVAQGTFSCDDVPGAASAIVATIQGYFVLAATARSVIPRGSAARSTRLMAQGLLRPASPSALGGPI